MDEKILNVAKEKFEELTKNAKDIVNNNGKLKEIIGKAEEKMKGLKINDTIKDLPIIFSMVKSFVSGEYKEVPVTTIVALVAALLYFITPNDIISDNVPVIGMVDDAAIVLICLKTTSADLEKYKAWMAKNGKAV